MEGTTEAWLERASIDGKGGGGKEGKPDALVECACVDDKLGDVAGKIETLVE